MPDIANALKFQKKMIAVESAYLNRIAAYRTETRRILLDILTRDGVSRAAVNQMTNEITALSRQVAGTARETSGDVRATVANYLRQQVRLAERAGLTDNADIAPVLNAGQQAASDGEQSYMINTSAWLKTLETNIQTNAARLRISEASRDETIDRLLSESLADGRSSVWLASGNQEQSEETTNVWTYGVGLLGAYLAIFSEQQIEQQPEVNYQKQAIATLDERTTDCCLQVHGQIQNIDDPFELDGTPRFADEIQDPPFHWYCRTSETLYNEEFEQFGIPTEEMEDAAQAELTAREETGKRVLIYPSSATSRR